MESTDHENHDQQIDEFIDQLVKDDSSFTEFEKVRGNDGDSLYYVFRLFADDKQEMSLSQYYDLINLSVSYLKVLRINDEND